jgi:AcrR family transcriptional regulator
MPEARRRPGPRRRPEAGKAAAAPTRQILFDAAAREFALHGFAGGSVDRIATAARLNKAMIYYHFGSKARLYAEILHDMFHAVGERVRVIARSGVAPDEKVRRFVDAIATEAEARPHFPPIWFREIADGGKHLGDATLREVAAIVSTLGDFIQEGVRAGEFVAVPHVLVHAGIVGPLLLFFASGPLRARMERAGVRGAGRLHRDLVVDHVQNVTLGILRGIAGEPGRQAKSRTI